MVRDDLSDTLTDEQLWQRCRKKFTNPVLDFTHVAGELGMQPKAVSKRLHEVKRSMGIKGKAVYICLDDGNVYLAEKPHSMLGTL